MKYSMIFLLLCVSVRLFATTFTVTNTNDTGSGSLRDALNYAIILSGNNVIVFNTIDYGNIIRGNYIGVDVSGTFAIPNTYAVLFDDGAANNIVGGSLSVDRNVLSGNSGYGVFIYNLGTHSNIVKGNYIGTDYTGTNAVPNANGIVIFCGKC